MIVAALMTWLQKRLGLVLGTVVSLFIQKYGARAITAFFDLFRKRRRKAEQEKAAAKVEDDVQKEKPRDDELRKHELEHLNS